jgi:hypothetical protein
LAAHRHRKKADLEGDEAASATIAATTEPHGTLHSIQQTRNTRNTDCLEGVTSVLDIQPHFTCFLQQQQQPPHNPSTAYNATSAATQTSQMNSTHNITEEEAHLSWQTEKDTQRESS